MNFVVFSYSFPPLNDSEAFCSARFCSAVADMGHVVHVVTMDHPADTPQEIVRQLVSPALKITRVPLWWTRKHLWSRLRYLTTELGSGNFSLAIETLKKVLGQYESPILISRSFPESSHVISYYARHLAKMWIAHFSDPIPFAFGDDDSLKVWMWRQVSLRWMRRAIKGCDAVSLTCGEARRFYHETYGALFDAKPVLVNQHVGNPPLKGGCTWRKPFTEKLIVHSGGLNAERGARQIVDALNVLNGNGLKFRFIQAGNCDQETERIFAGRPDIEVLGTVRPDLASAVVESADISLVSDVQVPMEYTPFMPSKFVYQLFSDRPLVLYSKPGSPMWRVAAENPSAGLFLADYTHPSSLPAAVQRAVAEPFNMRWREPLRKKFDRAVVAENFLRQLEQLL